MKTVRDIDVQNKRALVRCDFNVPFDGNGKIQEDFRIVRTLPTIKYLAGRGAKIILISHLGEGELSLKPIASRLEQLLAQPVKFCHDCVGKKVVQAVGKIKSGSVVLLENLRFHKGEKENDPEFAAQLARLGDVYINDAFGVCHRAHASVAAIAGLLPSVAGLLLESEITTLSRILENPERPLVVILGGVKIETKALLIEKFLEIADSVLLGGKIANTLLATKGLAISSEMQSEDGVAAALSRISLTDPKLHPAVDGLIALKTLEGDYLRVGSPASARNEEAVFDIGPETVAIFSEIIKGAKTIFWSGPMGYFEDKRFVQGSLAVADAIIASPAFSVAGGGDTTSFLDEYHLLDKFGYVSTGGGAMLEFLSGKALPGIEALNDVVC